jgi:hypothetical protein
VLNGADGYSGIAQHVGNKVNFVLVAKVDIGPPSAFRAAVPTAKCISLTQRKCRAEQATIAESIRSPPSGIFTIFFRRGARTGWLNISTEFKVLRNARAEE